MMGERVFAFKQQRKEKIWTGWTKILNKVETIAQLEQTMSHNWTVLVWIVIAFLVDKFRLS